MNIKKWLRNWLLDDKSQNEPIALNKVRANGYHGKLAYKEEVVCESDHEVTVETNNTVRFVVAKAHGGYIVQTKNYNRTTDCNSSNLHIIKDEEDFSEALGKIVTIESMRA